ncbi:neuronal acetylcholine receptor subunit alpha-7-like isoform X2 [Electrophorus electricus]|uniref:neuronal acetylcholine receptor subunit alpha-7-like isoform X2 n=1 Tax=Electrophorus electricus TaxID=8005 RepID=UPI0015D08EAF|nr:neuronal acetylcholine receptor subunit alpha-7-like isoform X2 [Electrophorus electricus]
MGSCTFTVSVVVTACLWSVSLQGEHQRRLYSDLMRDYNPLERPVFNDTHTLTVNFSLSLMQIIDVDEKNQVLTTNIWLQLYWYDHYLKWNISEYADVMSVRFPDNQIWKPDILLYNSADEQFDATFHTNVLVVSNGACHYMPPGIFKSTCYIDVRWFPFDVQQCELKFGSWTYGGWALDLQMNEADITGYIANGEWDLVGITVLLSLTVFMLLVAEIMPATSDSVPLIAQYFATTMVIVGLSVIATVWVLQYHYHDPDGGKMPTWTRVVLLNWCAWFLRMKRPGEERVRSACRHKQPRGSVSSGELSSGTVHPPSGNVLYLGTHCAASPDSGAICSRLVGAAEEDTLLPGAQAPSVSDGRGDTELAKILEEVRYIAKRFRDQDEEESICNEWKFAASVIDRLCVVAFSMFTILCTIGILMSAPNSVEAISKDFFT